MSWMMALLPYYLFSNLHCLGMCGPLSILAAKQKQSAFFLLGRLIGFSLMGAFCAAVGVQLAAISPSFFALLSLGLGLTFCSIAFRTLPHVKLANTLKATWLNTVSTTLQKAPPFFLGLCLPLLPCGQSFIVFSASALAPTPSLGLINSFTFALCTTPGLFLAIFGWKNFQQWSKFNPWVTSISLFIVGTLSILRGLATLEVIEHAAIEKIHLVFW